MAPIEQLIGVSSFIINMRRFPVHQPASDKIA